MRSNHTLFTVISRCFLGAALGLLGAIDVSAQADVRLDLTYPNGGESFPARSKVNIHWSGVEDGGIDSVRLEYTINGGTSWNTIVDIFGGDSSYQWTVPNVASTHCKVRMTQVRGYIGAVDSIATIATDGAKGNDIRFSNDGRRVLRLDASSTSQFAVTIWDAATGALVRSFDFKSRATMTPIFDPTGDRIIVAMRNTDTGHVEVWNIETGVREAFFDAPWNPRYPKIRNDIRDMAINPDGTEIAVAARTMLAFWNPKTGELVDTLDHIELVDVEYSDDGKRFIWRGASTSMTELDAKTHAELRTIPGSFREGTFSRDLRWFLTTDSTAAHLILWDMKSGTIAHRTAGDNPAVGVHGMLSADGRYLLYWQTGGKYLWVHDISDNTNMVRIDHGSPYTAIFDPQVMRVATLTSATGAVTLWPLQHVDESEGEFTITNPLPTLAAITFDSLKVGAVHDSTLQTYVRNTGSQPMTIDRIVIASGDTADFSVTSGGGTSTLGPGDSRPITIRFSPSTVGPRSAWLEVQTSGGPIAGELRGFGQRGLIARITTEIDFGKVVIGDSTERTITLFRNDGNASIRIDSIVPTGLYRTSFFATGGVPGEIAPGGTLQATIRFKPTLAGVLTSSLVAQDEYGRGYAIQASGEGLLEADAPLEPVSPGGSDLVQHITPNPASTSIRFECRLHGTAALKATLLDMSGRAIAEYDLGSAETGVKDVRLEIPDQLPAGGYVLLVLHGTEHEAHTIMVVR